MVVKKKGRGEGGRSVEGRFSVWGTTVVHVPWGKRESVRGGGKVLVKKEEKKEGGRGRGAVFVNPLVNPWHKPPRRLKIWGRGGGKRGRGKG